LDQDAFRIAAVGYRLHGIHHNGQQPHHGQPHPRRHIPQETEFGDGSDRIIGQFYYTV
jgi:hypothetical protein